MADDNHIPSLMHDEDELAARRGRAAHRSPKGLVEPDEEGPLAARRSAPAQDDAVRAAARTKALAGAMNGSTGLSWLWAFLFNWIYFAVHGFWGWAAFFVLVNLAAIAFLPAVIFYLVAPFVVYPAWRKRAAREADRALAVQKLLS